MKTETLFGIHPVFEALKAGRRQIHEVYVVKKRHSRRLEPVLVLAESKNIPVERINPSQLKSKAGTDLHQGIGAKTGPFPLTEISDLVEDIRSDDETHFLLLLDSILDPQNFGALVRTALCVGVNGIIIPKDRSVFPTPTVSKTSAGALEHIHLSRITNMVNTIKTLKKKDIWIAGMDNNAERSIYSCDLTAPVAIVVGGEEKGMRPLVKKHCDFLMSIPQTGPINSLNASVAGAVGMYEAFRQRMRLKNG